MSTLEERLLAKALDHPEASVRDGCASPLNHHWEDSESERNPVAGGWYLTMRCVKCGTVTRQIIYKNGAITPRRYKYPPGWTKSNWSRSEWRANYIAKLNGRS